MGRILWLMGVICWPRGREEKRGEVKELVINNCVIDWAKGVIKVVGQKSKCMNRRESAFGQRIICTLMLRPRMKKVLVVYS